MPPPSNDWPLLNALWQATSRLAAVVMLGLVGAWIGGLTLGLATFFVYMIGIWLGVPLGFVIGMIIGARIPKLDTLFVFGVGVGVWVLSNALIPASKESPMMTFVVASIPTLLGAACAVISLALRSKVQRPAKFAIGLTANTILAVFGVIGYLRHIYQ